MDQSNFTNYKKIKEKFNYSYKGYNIKYIIPGYLNFIFDENVPSSKDIFKSFVNSFEIFDFRSLKKTKQETLITYLINRSDYQDLAYAAQKLYPNSEVVNIESLPKKKVSILGITYISHVWLAIWIICSRNIGKGIPSKLYLIASVTKILNIIKHTEQANISNVNQYICFNSAYREEAILTAYFNKRSIETITMQHGIFCDFRLKIPFDIINHENMTAQKLLCWGQSTIDYMSKEGMDASRFILEGNLKYRNISIEHINQNFKKCLVLLGRGNYIDTNNKLLETLSEFNTTSDYPIKFYVKKHPFLDDKEHKQFANIKNDIVFIGKEHTVQEVLESSLVDFSIAVNTTAYYESLALGKPCLRWVEAENEVFFGMDDKFENILEFKDRISQLKNMDQLEILKQIKQVIKYIFNPNLTI